MHDAHLIMNLPDSYRDKIQKQTERSRVQSFQKHVHKFLKRVTIKCFLMFHDINFIF